MFAQATTFILAVTLARGSSPFDGAMQQLNPTQLHVVGTVGKFLQQKNMPAPWMQTPQMRRMQDDSPTVVIPPACLAACPSVEQMAPRLQNSMVAAIMPYMADFQTSQAASGGDSENLTPAQFEEKMKSMMPLFKAMFTVTFDDMCANQADYKCLVTNNAKCKSENSMGVMGMGQDPIGTAGQYGPTMDCICDKCQGAKAALAESTTSLMSIMLTGLVNMMTSFAGASGDSSSSTAASSASQTALEAQMEKDLLQGMCPLVTMKRCFDANPTQCGTMLAPENMNNMNTTGFDTKCSAAGIKALVAPAVSTQITIKGLDFAKVDGDAAIKAEVVAMVKNQFLAKLPGYVAADLTVTLSSGSVVAKVEVAPVPGASTETLLAVMKDDSAAMAAAIAVAVHALPDDKLAKMLEEGTTKDKIAVYASAPTSTATPTSASSAHATGVLKIIMAMAAQVVLLASM